MFGLNPFEFIRTLHTSSILWLRVLVFLIIVASLTGTSYVENTTVRYVLYGIIALSIISVILYLTTGHIIPTSTIGSHIIPLQSGLPASIKMIPDKKTPFTSTHLYYVVIQDTLGRDLSLSNTNERGSSFIEWKDYYRIGLDKTTGTLYFKTDRDSIAIGKLPVNSLVQIAIIQNQKTFAISLDGKRYATVVSSSLPPSKCLQQTPIINRDGIISSGIVYHKEIIGELMEEQDLLRHRERVSTVYTNTSLFQNTPLPKTPSVMGVFERTSGATRVALSAFSYQKAVDTGLHAIQ